MIGRYLNLGSPVETAHPLNLGLLLWFLPLPNNQGGLTVFDLMGRHTATLTGGSLWGASPVAGRLAPDLDGVDNYLSVPVATGSALDALSTGSAVFHLRYTSSSQVASAYGFGTVWGRTDAATYNNFNTGLFEAANPAASRLFFAPYTFNSEAVVSASNFGLNQDRVLGLTWTSGAQAMYFDGVSEGTGTQAGSMAADSSALTLGGWVGGGQGYFGGRFYSARLYDRVLSAADMAALYQEIVTDYPRTLRRWSRRRWLDVPAAAGGAATVPYRTLMGVGV
jgi:hypothetical protein